jgi:hypothetical protein
MSYIVTPFEVVSRGLPELVKCSFVHLLSGIATRHSDTIDCIFLVDGRKVTIEISCAALAQLRENKRESLSDQRLADIAALALRHTLERGNDPTDCELFLGEKELMVLTGELGYA